MVTDNSQEPRSKLWENNPLDLTHFKTHRSETLSEGTQHQINPRTVAYPWLNSHTCCKRASESAVIRGKIPLRQTLEQLHPLNCKVTKAIKHLGQVCGRMGTVQSWQWFRAPHQLKDVFPPPPAAGREMEWPRWGIVYTRNNWSN